MRIIKKKIYYKDWSIEIRYLLVLLIIFSSIAIFLSVANNISLGITEDFDAKIMYAFRESGNISNPIGGRGLVYVMRDITALGGVTVIFIITLFTSLFLIIEKHYRTLFLTLSCVISGGVLDFILKDFYARSRPYIIPHLIEESSASFPSGHSMMGVLVYLSIAILVAGLQSKLSTKIFLITFALFISLAIGISRIYLGVHFPTDVVGGWLLGLAWALIFYLLSRKISKKSIINKQG